MVHLRSTQTSTIASLGLVFTAFCLVAAAISFKESGLSGFLPLVPCVYFIPLTILALTAKTVAVDSDRVRITRKNGVEIVPVAEIASVRTMPVFRFIDAFWIKDSKGRWTRTLIPSDTLSQAMAMMPRDALTPYWQNRI